MPYGDLRVVIDEISRRTDILQVVGTYVELRKKSGANHFGLCPFHKEKTPSFSVNVQKQIYHCFGCGAGGDVFTFLMNIENISFMETVRMLAGQVGVEIPERETDPKKKAQSDRILAANEVVNKWYQKMLFENKEGKKRLKYLENRGLSSKVIDSFEIGYDPGFFTDMIKLAEKSAVKAEDLVRAGILIESGIGGKYSPRFSGRITFPIRNTGGKLVAFGARSIGGDEKAPKYINSPESAIFKKGMNLYNLYRAKDTIRNTRRAIVVEGYMDVIALVSHGVDEVVASSGTAFTEMQARLLRRFCDRATLVFDGDDAGTAAAVRACDEIIQADLEAEVVILPEDEDPDSLIRKNGTEAFRELLKCAVSSIDFKVEALSKKYDVNSVSGKSQMIRDVTDSLLKLDDEVRRDLLLSHFAEKIGIDHTLIRREIFKKAHKRFRSPKETTVTVDTPAENSLTHAENFLIGYIVRYPDGAHRTIKEFGKDVFRNAAVRSLAEVIERLIGEDVDYTPQDVMVELEYQPAKNLLSKLLMTDTEPETIHREFEACLLDLRLERINNRLKEMNVNMKKALQDNKKADYESLKKQYAKLLEKKRTLVTARSGSRENGS